MARRIVLRSEEEPDRPSSENLTIDYKEDLNPQQYAAATAGDGPLLIVAGAGTGKTRTLIYRLAYLVETGTHPERIVLLTFTRRAANDMTARAAHLLDGRCEKVQGGTFHAFCLQVLRRHAPTLDLPRNFTVLDAADAADVLSVLRARGDYGDGEERFPKKQTLYKMFSGATNRDESLGEVLTRRYPQYTGQLKKLKNLQSEYRRYKQGHGMLDFDDLLERTLELFDRDDEVRRQVASRCKHVLVDEYQDTNALQADLVKKFASVHGNVTVVGDDAQSIYRFRGADFRNIFRFPDEYPDAEILKLEQNYRSTQPILDLANHVIEQADRSYEKTLFSEDADGDLPALVPAPDGEMESRFVAQMIMRLREDGVPLSDIAVLFRSSHNAYDLEVELNRRNIPFVKYGGMKLNEAAHIKDVLAHLKVAENPQDAASWNRTLQLIHGIGPKTAQDLIEWATEAADDPFVPGDGMPFSSRYVSRLKELLGVLRTIRDPDVPVSEQVETVLDYYQPIFEEEYAEDYPKREPDLDHLVGLAANYQSRQRFLSSLALDPIELTALEQEAAEDDEPPLVLSTIHSAKGLEFHTVFVIRALDGTIPSRHALREDGGVDEELRLFYVACTRAEENLFISYPMTQYRRSYGEYMTDPSRFVADVPEEVLEPVQLVEEDAPDAVGRRTSPPRCPRIPRPPTPPNPLATGIPLMRTSSRFDGGPAALRFPPEFVCSVMDLRHDRSTFRDAEAVASIPLDIAEVGMDQIDLIRRLNVDIFGDEHIINTFDRDDILILVARSEGRAVGFKLGYRLDESTFYSAKGGVRGAYRRNGIARALLYAMLAVVDDRGYERFVYDTFPNKHPGMTVMGLDEGFRVVRAGYSSRYKDYRLRFALSLDEV